MTYRYYCAIFPFCGGGKKKKTTKKTKAIYDWATTGIPVIKKKTTKKTKAFYDWATTGIPVMTVNKRANVPDPSLRKSKFKSRLKTK